MKQSRYPIAVNISATSASDTLLGLKDNKTRNFKISDIITLAVNSVTLSAQDITSESINIGLTSGNLDWNRLSNVPTASSATSGILSVYDYNRFSSATGIITSSDIPTLPASKIQENSVSRFVSDSQISYWNALSAGNIVVSSIDIADTTGSLEWNRLISIPVATTNTNGIVTSSDWNTFNNKVSDLNILSAYLPLSGGNVTGNLSANSFTDNNFVGNRVLISNSKLIDESLISVTELSHLSNISANIQTQLNQLSQNAISGTVNKISKFITSSSVGDSSITDNGSLVTFSTQVSSNNDITALTFTGLASTATSALQADRLKTARTFSISGDVTANNLSFDGQQNIILSANISNLSPSKIATDSFNRFVSDYDLNTLSAINANVLSNSANWNSAYTSAHNHNNKSTLDLINQSLNTSAAVSFASISATSITVGNISNTELQYLDGISANIQTQLLSLSAKNITSADVPTLPPSKILEDSNDRFVSDSQISYWNSLSAGNVVVSAINISLTSGSLGWNRLSAVPVASTNTSGVLTSSDWNTFNNKVSNLNSLSAYLPLSGGTINGNLSATNISASTLNIGTISNTEFQYLDTVSANIQTQLTNLSARTITSSDIPTLPPSKIATNSTNRFVTDSQIAQWDNNTSGTSAIVDLSYSLILEANKNKLYFLSGATANVTSSAPSATNFSQSLSPLFSGQRDKIYTVVGPTSGTYQATIIFYGTSVNREPWIYPDNCVITTISNTIPSATGTFKNNLIVWGVSLNVDSGTVTSPGISATVEV